MIYLFTITAGHYPDSMTIQPKMLYSCYPENTMQSMKYIWLTDTNELPDISQHAPFKVLLSIDETVSTDRQKAVSDWLVRMGAMHVTIRGEECTAWKDSIRRANLDMFSLDEIQPEQFVMIIPHPHEGLRSVFKQIKKHASHTHIELKFTVIIHLAQQSAQVEYQSIFSRL